MWWFLLFLDDLQDLLQHHAEQRGETAVHGRAEEAQLGVPPETSIKEENL